MHPMMQKARAYKQAEESKRRQVVGRQRAFEEALEELADRTYTVSMPGYDGSDSHMEIKEDKEALETYFDEIDGSPRMPPRGDQPAKGTNELLEEIKENLNAS